MATTNEELRVKILDAKKAETELKKVRKELEETTGASEGHGKASHKQAGGVEHVTKASHKLRSALSYGAALTGLGAVGYGLKDIVQGGLHAQEQQALLQQALKATGQQGAGHLERVNKALDHSETHGGFGVVEETEAVGQLLRRTQNVTKAIKLNSEAIAFARGAHLDYGTAIKMVSQIQTGNTGRLQKYLGIIQPVTSHVDALRKRTKQGNEATKEQIALYRRAHPGVLILGSALKEVNKKTLERAKLLDKEATAQKGNEALLKRYGGATDAYSKTAQGSISNANNAFKLATEELGQKTLPAVTDAAKWFAKLITSISQGHGAWGTLERDAKVVGEGLKDVWQYFEKNRTALKGLEIGLGILAGAWGIEKILRTYEAFKKLLIVQKVAGAFSRLGPAAAKGAEELAAEDAAFGGAGALLGEALVAGFVGYVGYNLGKELAKKVQIGFHPSKILKGEDPFSVTTAGSSPHNSPALNAQNKANEAAYRKEVEAHPYKTAHAEMGGPLGTHDPIVERFHKMFEIHNHVHLDGKEVAHSVGDHAIKDQKVARKFAEGAHGYTLRQKTHG